MAINWNVNWRLIYFYGVASKTKERMWYEGGMNPLPYKNKSLRGLRLVIVCYSSAYV
jgi:hypothetical protein